MTRITLAFALLAITGCYPPGGSRGIGEPVEETDPDRIPTCDELDPRVLIDVFEVEPPSTASSHERHFRAELWPTGEDVTEVADWYPEDSREIEFIEPGVAVVKVISSIPLPFEVAFCAKTVAVTVSPVRR